MKQDPSFCTVKMIAYRLLCPSTTFAALIAIGLVVATATVAQAVTKNWTGGSGDWSPGNWAPPGPPNAGDPVRIVSNDAVNRTVTLNITTPALGLVSLDNDGGRTSTLSIPTNVNLTAAAIAVGGYNGSGFTNGRGAVNQADGTVTTTSGSDLILAWGAGSTGTYTQTGGAFVANQAEFVGYAGTGTFNHSAGTNTINASALGSLTIGATTGSSGTYNLSGTGMLTTNAPQYVGYSGAGNFNQPGGTNTNNSSLYLGYNAGAIGTYTLSNSGSLVTGNAVIGSSGMGTLTIQDQASMHVSNNLSINNLSTVNLNGGTLGLNTSDGPSLSRINYSAGTIQLAGNRTIGSDAIVQTLFGEAPYTIPAGKALNVQGTATLQTALTLDGGTFSASQVINPQLLQVEHGTLEVANQARSIGSSEVLNLAADAVVNYGLGITNQGVLKGDGQIGGALFHNTSAGEVIAEIDKSLTIAALGNANDGRMTLAGGSLVFLNQLANNSGGTVSGNGTIVANGGLVNHGTMSFTGVTNVISSNISLLGQVSVAPQATLNFDSPLPAELGALFELNHGTVVASHGIVFGTSELRAEVNNILDGVAPALREDFLERQQDLASYTEQLLQAGDLGDPGELEMIALQQLIGQRQQAIQITTNIIGIMACPPTCVIANMRSTLIADTEVLGRFVPGGPAGISSVDIVGDLSVALRSEMEFEMAGTGPAQFDTLMVDGNASFEFGARLVLSMLDPSDLQNGTNLFLPQPGDYFDILTADTIDAEFLLIEAPEFDNRAFVAGVVDVGVDAGQALRITVVPVGLAGDYNQNGVVDAADYVLWRKNLGSGTSLPNDDTPGVGPDDYAVWRAYFGQTAPASGAGATANSSSSAVPEPTAALLMLLSLLATPVVCRRNIGATRGSASQLQIRA